MNHLPEHLVMAYLSNCDLLTDMLNNDDNTLFYLYLISKIIFVDK